ncbi:MAG: hypothetical protein PWQ64_1117 [Desulfomicrobiaceae bacterium]|jgi:hypothetical protein|nr:hypothetical protein [Desulfomicrobiaceae bacterium]MDK2873353.1 hypothetical protein [Desulfomicrobiaceae bacterium]
MREVTVFLATQKLRPRRTHTLRRVFRAAMGLMGGVLR